MAHLIKVLGHTYTIEHQDMNSLGEANFGTGQIRLDKTLSPDAKGSTLLHEVMHIISHTLDLNLSEQVVSAVALGVKSLIDNNMPDGSKELADICSGEENNRDYITNASLFEELVPKEENSQ